MGLNTFTPPTEVVQFPGGHITLRGLALNDLTRLVKRHGPQMRTIFSQLAGAGKIDLADASTDDILLQLLETAPGLIGDVIAHACDEPDNGTAASRLPATTQIEALEIIYRLTLEAEGGLEKLKGTVQRVARTLPGLPKP